MTLRPDPPAVVKVFLGPVTAVVLIMSSFVSVPGHTLAPISRLMALVWGNSDLMKDSKASKPKEAEKPKIETKTEKPETVDKRQKEVRIDASTMVPTDLYWSLLRSGERARNVGQHQLKSMRKSLGDEQHLIRT